ncbi:MAG: UbiA family prenyltransferase [Planctomycetota bacterium]
MARLLPFLRLVRAGTLFSPGCDVIAGICILGASSAPAPGIRNCALAVLASIGLYAAGMVWNDVADRREDARNRPERPLPSGDLSLTVAVLIGIALIAVSLLITPCRYHHAAIAGLLLAYDFFCKRWRWLGAMTMGSLRCLNLLVASSLFEASTTTQLPHRSLIVAGICYGIYILFVTILGILEDESSPRRGHVLLTQSIPPAAALIGILHVQGGFLIAPLIALVPLGYYLNRMFRINNWDQRAIRGSMLLLLLGTMFYTALLSLAAGSWIAALGITLCIVPARLIARRISLT